MSSVRAEPMMGINRPSLMWQEVADVIRVGKDALGRRRNDSGAAEHGISQPHSAQPKRIADDAYRRERHGGGGDDG